MLNIFDPLFNLDNTSDFLSVNDNGPLSSENIDNTINEMVKKIAAINGYTKVTPIGLDNHTYMDNLYNNDSSFVIPIFNEIPDNNDTLGKDLTKANFSFIMTTSKSGTINKLTLGTSSTTYSFTKLDGDINGSTTDLINLGEVWCDKLINLKFYRYISLDNDHKFDYNPLVSDFIDTLCYAYNGEDIYFGGNLFYLSLKQQIISLSPLFIPSNIKCTVSRTNIVSIGDGEDVSLITPEIEGFTTYDNYCHCYKKIYWISNKEN